jgi:peptidoglycan/xylan/chitin deacetylase (PgdA/CDA1 family)
LKKQVLVINYHQIDAGLTSAIPAIDKVFAVKKSTFEEQVKVFVKNKIPVISLADLVNNRITQDFAVVLTCDDGNLSDYQIIYPVLKANEMTATFFWLTGKPDLINSGQAQEMIKDGFTIASHGITHRDLTKLDLEDQYNELEGSKRILEEAVKIPVDYFSFPFGIYNNRTIEQSKKAGYKAVLTTGARLNYPGERPFVIHRWSVKRSTSLKQFESILTNNKALKKFILVSKIRKFAFKVLGRPVSDRLNLFIHSLTHSTD